MSFKTIYSLSSNEYNKNTKSYYEQNIDYFYNISKNLPEKPNSQNHNNYFEELTIYQEQMQRYFMSFCTCLHDICKNVLNCTDKFKRAYKKLYDEFKSYQEFLKKKKVNHESVYQNKLSQLGDDGSMSPSNPFYTMFDEDNLTDYNSHDLETNFVKSNTANEYFLKCFLEKMKDIRRYLRKEKRRSKMKKLTKNQKKKLKKKLRNQKSKESCSKELSEHVDKDEDPQLAIQDFFKKYSRTGEWSWTQWNSCISKIQEKFPQWFEVFSQYSFSMGINWNEMFMRDVKAVDLSNVRIDIESLSASKKSYSSSQEPTREGLSVIFTEPVVTNIVDEDSRSELYCYSCKLEFKSKRSFHIHIRGVKHIQNEIRNVSQQKPEIFIEEINKENASVLSDVNKEDKHTQWLLNNIDISKETGTYTCTMCNVHCTSQKDFKTHLNGDKHKSNSQVNAITPISTSVPETENIVKSTSISKSKRKPVARIQILLNQCTHALIGLNYINEYQKIDSLKECWYYCELCSVKVDRKHVIPHVVSFAHRNTYLKQHYQDLSELIEQDQSSKPVIMKRIEVYSEQVEMFEGRKKINIMIEKKSDCIMENSVLQKNVEISLGFECDENREQSVKAQDTEILPNENGIFKIFGLLKEGAQLDVDIDSGDKEDGEIASSDDDAKNEIDRTILIKKAVSKSKKTDSVEQTELEAGEIENEMYENDNNDSDPDMDLNATLDSIKLMPNAINKCEFENYEPLYISDRPPMSTQEPFNENGKIKFIRSNKKRVKFSDVTDDILDHFKQEAVWALNRVKQTNTCHIANTKSLLLPPSELPIGPSYPGVSELKAKSISISQCKSINTDTNLMSAEIEFTNIIDKIESIIGKELTVNRLQGKCDANDKNLIYDVQNMLVNKTGNDKLNEVIRKELLVNRSDIDSNNGYSCFLNNKLVRKHILNNPVNVHPASNEVVVKDVASLSTTETGFRRDITGSAVVGTALHNENQMNHYISRNDESVSTTTMNLNSAKMGAKMMKYSEFLGLDQPPPPSNFRKSAPKEHYFDPPKPSLPSHFLNVIPNAVPVIPHYFTPGMIEHQSAYSNYNSPNFLYQYQIISQNSSHNSSEILSIRNRTGT